MKAIVEINLNEYAKSYNNVSNHSFLDPCFCQAAIDEFHFLHDCITFGGYGEDRSFIWAGSYLEKRKNFIHLGIDINLPQDTRVCFKEKVKILKIDSDFPDENGWGNRIIANVLGTEDIIIYAHVCEISCLENDIVNAKSHIAKIANKDLNGGWFPHLHVQLTDSCYYFENIVKNGFVFDGYGFLSDLKFYKNPIKYIL